MIALVTRISRAAPALQRHWKGRVSLVVAILSLYCLVLATGAAETPGDFSIEAFSGSYAPWGSNQYLTVDASRNMGFYWSSLDSDDGDSVLTTITLAEAQAVYDTVMAVNFFALDSLYDSGDADGSGVILRITASGTVHSVEVKNMSVAQVNRVVTTINTLLGPYGVFLKYGALNE